jgi:hypothetical protein
VNHYFDHPFHFSKESLSTNILIIGIGGGGDIITSLALGEYIKSLVPVTIRYANTKRKYQARDELAGISLAKYSEELYQMLKGHLKIEKAIAENFGVYTDIFFCPETILDESALIHAFQQINVDEVWAVDTGGDVLSEKIVDFSSDRDVIMLQTLLKAFPDLKLFVVSPGSDGESTLKQIDDAFNLYRKDYLGFHPVLPLLPVFERFSRYLSRYRTPNIILDAIRSQQNSSEEVLYNVPRGIHPDIPMKYLKNFFVFNFDGIQHAVNIDEDPEFALLSNFSEIHFNIDGVECQSMEGFLQSLKFEDPEEQKTVCKLIGKQAKFRGKKKKWWRTQKLYWMGREVDRHSKAYQQLLDRAFDSLARNENFSNVLKSTSNRPIIHPGAKDDAYRTVLTRNEFIYRLEKIRAKLMKHNLRKSD